MDKLVYLINCPPGWTKTAPLGLEYIKQYLAKHGIKTKIIDFNILTHNLLALTKNSWLSLNRHMEENIFSLIQKKYPDTIKNLVNEIDNASLVGISVFKRNRSFSFSLGGIIKDKYPETPVVFGGPETLFMKLRRENFLSRFNWVIGEGEKGLKQMIACNKRGLIEHEELDDLDQIPFLEFDGTDLNSYSQFIPLLSSRGCIKKCRFCTEHLLYKKFRQHSPQYIADQIEYLGKKYNRRDFSFQDSLINARLDWLHRFCSLIIKRNLKISWDAQVIIRNDFPLEMAKLLKKSGCFNLFVGLESASDNVLENMDKKITSQEAITFFTNLKTAGLHFEVSLIFGYPGESDNDFNTTVRFIIENKNIIPKIAQVNPFVDYFAKEENVAAEAIKRVDKFIAIINKEKIPFTKSFINNLTYSFKKPGLMPEISLNTFKSARQP
ncbi:MAG: radical SAM protein [Candidatus Omnitrophota bacterium]